MPTWTLKADRRKADLAELFEELRLLGESIEGLSVELAPAERFDQGPDAGGFRDFAPIATLSHDSLAALELVAEEILLDFGWLVDFSK